MGRYSAVVSALFLVTVSCGGRTEGEQPGRTKELASTSSVDGSGCASTGAGGPWATGDIGARTGTFVVEADVSVSESGSDALFGLSSGVARTYPDLAAIVRFNSSGKIDARNGGSYQADDSVPYTPGTPYHVRFDVDANAHTYSVTVSWANGTLRVGTNYAFRTEQAGVSELDHFALKVDAAGAIDACGFGIAELNTCRTAQPGAGFVNVGFPSQSRMFTASFRAVAEASGIDGVLGFSGASASAFNDLATAVRFNPGGTIDARNGDAYLADRTMAYQAGSPPSIQILADVPAHAYTTIVDGQVLLRTAGFRTQQSGVASLSNLASIADSDAGAVTSCYLSLTPSRAVYSHDTYLYGGPSVYSMAPKSDGTLLLADTLGSTFTLDANGLVLSYVRHGGYVHLDDSENIYLVGLFSGVYQPADTAFPSAGGTDVFVSKFDRNWNHVWTRTFGSENDDRFSPLPAFDARGDVVVGNASSILGPPNEVMAFDSSGNVLWTLERTPTGAALDGAGNVVLDESNQDSSGFTVSKLDRTGATLFSRSFPADGFGNADLVRVDGKGDIVIAGRAAGTIHFAGGDLTVPNTENGPQAYVAKLDPNGFYLGSAITTMNFIEDATLDAAGDIFLSGIRFNPGFIRLNQFDPGLRLVRSVEGRDVVPSFGVGFDGAIAVDAAGNVYWEVTPRAGDSANLQHIVKIAPQ